MNAVDILKADHEKVRSLFDQIDQVEEFPERKRLFQNLKAELESHSFIEETIFYPLLAQKKDFQELVDQAIDDHLEMKEILEEFNGLNDADTWDDRFGELLDCVEDHVDEEEEELLPRAEEVFSREELDVMGDRIAEVRRTSAKAA